MNVSGSKDTGHATASRSGNNNLTSRETRSLRRGRLGNDNVSLEISPALPASIEDGYGPSHHSVSASSTSASKGEGGAIESLRSSLQTVVAEGRKRSGLDSQPPQPEKRQRFIAEKAPVSRSPSNSLFTENEQWVKDVLMPEINKRLHEKPEQKNSTFVLKSTICSFGKYLIKEGMSLPGMAEGHVDIDAHVEGYCQFLQAEGKQPKSVTAQKNYLAYFVNHVKGKGFISKSEALDSPRAHVKPSSYPLSDIDEKWFQDVLEPELKKFPNTKRTISQYIKRYVRLFGCYLNRHHKSLSEMKEETISENIAFYIKSLEEQGSQFPIADVEEYLAYLKNYVIDGKLVSKAVASGKLPSKGYVKSSSYRLCEKDELWLKAGLEQELDKSPNETTKQKHLIAGIKRSVRAFGAYLLEHNKSLSEMKEKTIGKNIDSYISSLTIQGDGVNKREIRSFLGYLENYVIDGKLISRSTVSGALPSTGYVTSSTHPLSEEDELWIKEHLEPQLNNFNNETTWQRHLIAGIRRNVRLFGAYMKEHDQFLSKMTNDTIDANINSYLKSLKGVKKENTVNEDKTQLEYLANYVKIGEFVSTKRAARMRKHGTGAASAMHLDADEDVKMETVDYVPDTITTRMQEVSLDQARTAFHDVVGYDLTVDGVVAEIALKDAAVIVIQPTQYDKKLDRICPIRNWKAPLQVTPSLADKVDPSKCDERISIKEVNLYKGWKPRKTSKNRQDDTVDLLSRHIAYHYYGDDPLPKEGKAKVNQLLEQIKDAIKSELTATMRGDAPPSSGFIEVRKLTTEDVPSFEAPLVGQHGVFAKKNEQNRWPSMIEGRVLGIFAGSKIETDEQLGDHYDNYTAHNVENYAINLAGKERIVYAPFGGGNAIQFVNTSIKTDENGKFQIDYDRINAMFVEAEVVLLDQRASEKGKNVTERVIVLVGLPNLCDADKEELEVRVSYGDTYLDHFNKLKTNKRNNEPSFVGESGAGKRIKTEPKDDNALLLEHMR